MLIPLIKPGVPSQLVQVKVFIKQQGLKIVYVLQTTLFVGVGVGVKVAVGVIVGCAVAVGEG
jgi:hypothetical protein